MISKLFSVSKISLIIALLGIFLLLILSNLEPDIIFIKDISTKDLNKKVKVQGTIFNIKSYKESNFQVISIKDSAGKIDITSNKILILENNQEIIVIGIVNSYKNNLQIEAENIVIT